MKMRNSGKKQPKTPTTFEEAVDFMAAKIKPDDVKNPYYHFTGGMAMRNGLGLWDKESPLYKHMLNRFGLCHADDTGGLISSAADAKVNGLTYSPKEDVERYKNHWIAMGYDPTTMEKL